MGGQGWTQTYPRDKYPGVPLFNIKTIEAALTAWPRQPGEAEVKAAAEWAARASAVGFPLQNESQLEQEFNQLIVQGVLGYRAPTHEAPGSMRVKQPIGAGAVDLALGSFDDDTSSIVAPFELKGPKAQLDLIMPGRAKTPVQQAWEYAMDAPGAKWVLVSNMRELRLYAVGYGRAAFETFDFRRLGDPAELRRLQLLLHAEQLLTEATADLLRRSASEDRDITDALYLDYRGLRDDLLQYVQDQRPDIEAEQRIAVIQKLLDRLIFIAFAEDTVLLPDDCIKRAVEFANPYDPQPKWHQVKRLFEWIDQGSDIPPIPAYNGGLFRKDQLLDGLDLPDPIVERFARLCTYDFRSQVSVTILGHIFEQSISDIERDLALARGEPAPKTSKRKREGVVYTPDFVTRFIVERTIGAHLADIATELLAMHSKGEDAGGTVHWKGKTGERDYWRAYLDRLASLRIIDPACGSGAFLIAAFDFLHSEQRKVRQRLGELDPGLLVLAHEAADVEIITRNLYGVDVSAESVEITKLALWLKTAKPGRQLESLRGSIQQGNSLIEDSDYHNRAFIWNDAFQFKAEGGFDIVIGNPPYVRMELLKAIKPYLEKRYEVVSDRADLYAYFFELGVRLLKPGGRLGYVSSSTFFRTGSGAPLRRFLSEKAEIETMVDFGDLQIFEGVTTYPTIISLRKRNGASSDENLRFLNITAMPDDLSKHFEEEAEPMPRSRLSIGSWRFEGDRLDAIRAKLVADRQTLEEVYGSPLYGIKTGLNEAFVVDRETRDSLIVRDAHSADILRPFLVGENLKRWHSETDDLWLIYTPKHRIEIEEFPAIRDHLMPFRPKLEARATKQEWWELQQAQAAYRPFFEAPKIMYPSISQGPKFSVVRDGSFGNDKTFSLRTDSPALMALLGSKAIWLILFGEASPLRGGQWRLELREQYMSQVPIVEAGPEFDELEPLGRDIQDSYEQLVEKTNSVHNRFGDVAPEARHLSVFGDWPKLDFDGLRALLKKRLRAEIPVSERDQWESYFTASKAEVEALSAHIADAEAEINERVFRLFNLNQDEVAAIDDALVGQY